MKSLEDTLKDTLTYKICKERCIYFRFMVAVHNKPNEKKISDALYDVYCTKCPVRDMENKKICTIMSKEAN